MSKNQFLAIDLGAESGRGVAGVLEDGRLFLEEVHRFPTRMLMMNDHYYWNIYRFYEEILSAINLSAHKEKIIPESLAIDTWGVDFGFLQSDGSLKRIPYAYRDPQTLAGRDAFLEEIMTAEEIYKLTGIAIQPFNSVYHLYALMKNRDIVLDQADTLLFIPDLLNYFLTGEKKTEFTFATTSQLYNPNKGDWEEEIFKAMGLDISLMAPIVRPGNKTGMLKMDIGRRAAVGSIPVIAACSHDTGSAIVSVPAEGEDWAYISSGTWSLMGVEMDKPVITEESFRYNFTNEGGAEGTFRYLKNIMGLWLLQQCRESWIKTGYTVSYTELVDTARTSHPFKTFIDPDHEGFYNPEDMPAAIDRYCTATGQESPETVGEYVRTILEGLAFKYRMVLDQLHETTPKKIKKIHIIGGGAQNKMLCQFTANATGVPVIAGPAEGTATGNILMQARAMGILANLNEMREIVRNSFSIETYRPENVERWEEAYANFQEKTQEKVN